MTGAANHRGTSDWMSFAREQAGRFWSHVARSEGCWTWSAGLDKDGYGKFAISLPRVNGRQKQKHVRAHRLAYLLTHGDIPDGLLIRHSCDNPRCCNPEHVLTGTQLQNRGDAVDRNRVARGERHGMRKLTADKVREIRRKSALGARRIDLAAEFSISYPQICSIVTRREWRGVEP